MGSSPTAGTNNQTTTFSYDLLDRQIQTNFPDGGQVTQTYNETSTPLSLTTSTKITAGMNLVSTVTVDGIGRVVLSSLDNDPQGVTRTKTEYDTLGRKARVYNPTRCNPPETNCGESTWGYTDFEYDALSRTTKVIPPDGSSSSNNITTSYSGNKVTVTDQAGKQRRSTTDALGRLTQVDEPNPTLGTPAVTTYTYDALDNLTNVLQSGSRPRTFTYDSLSQLTQANNPESGIINYTYDLDGNVVRKVDARGVVTCFGVWNGTTCDTSGANSGYDDLHRLRKKTYSDSTPMVRYSYDGLPYDNCASVLGTVNAIGRRTAMCDGAGQESWSYEIVLDVDWKTTDRRTTNGVTKDFVYQNNLDGSLWKLTYPSGRIITYAYSAAARALSAVDSTNGINYALSASCAPQGALANVVHGQVAGGFAGITLAQTYNNRLQPSTIVASSTNGTVLDFAYCFNANFDPATMNCAATPVANNGNVAFIANNRNTNRTQKFSYDELNRVKIAQSSATSGTDCWGLQFGYDIWANLLSATTTKCAPPNLNLSMTTKNQISNSGFAFDAAGNLTYDPGNLATYQYDAENRMISASGTLGNAAYTFDGDGKRAWKAPYNQPNQPNKLYWYGMGSEALDETDAAGNTNNASFAEYVFFGGKRIGKRDFSNNVSYYFADHLGSSRVVTNATGGILDDSDFYPFGGERTVVSSSGNNYKFTGKERDTESGLDFFIARYYSSQYGRFLSPDEFTGGPVDAFSSSDPLPPSPLPYADITNPQSLNKYAYTFNNPLRYTDPNGHYAESAWDFASLLAGIHSYVQNVKQGNVGAAIVDSVGIVADTAALILPGVPGGAGNGLKAIRAAGSVWDLPAVKRGAEIAKQLGQNLPEWFPAFDKFKDGIATSIKSLDLGAATYQNVGKLTSKLQGYVDKISGVEMVTKGGKVVENIKKKVLELAIQKGKASKEQKKVLEELREYGEKKGVEVKVIEIK